MNESEVGRTDVLLVEHRRRKPRKESTPILRTKKHNREITDLFCLNECESFEELIHRTIAAREDQVSIAVLDEHRFPHEEIFEGERFRQIWIRHLFEWKFDVAADRNCAGFESSAIGCFHYPGPAAGNYLKTGFC